MSSESVIRDADMAEEMTKFTRNQIMVQSSTAMLAQANARSQSVLSLLS
jgi:flagellin